MSSFLPEAAVSRYQNYRLSEAIGVLSHQTQSGRSQVSGHYRSSSGRQGNFPQQRSRSRGKIGEGHNARKRSRSRDRDQERSQRRGR